MALPFCHKPPLPSPMAKRRSDLPLSPPLPVLPRPAPDALPAAPHAIPTAVPMLQLPLSTLDALPGPAHAIIATLLPDGDQVENRLCLSLVSRSMLVFHGGTLTVLRGARSQINKRRRWSPWCSGSVALSVCVFRIPRHFPQSQASWHKAPFVVSGS